MPTVLHVHTHPWAGMPYRMERALNSIDGWSALRIQLKPGLASGMGFPEGRSGLSVDERDELFGSADIIHAHGLDVLPYATGCNRNDVPVVVTIHGEPDRRHLGDQAFASLPKAARIIHVVTPDLLEFYPGATFIPNFVLDADVAKVPAGRASSDRVRVYRPVGHKWKNHDEFANLRNRCAGRHPHVGRFPEIGFCVQGGRPGSVSNAQVLAAMAESNVVWDHLQGYFGVTTIEAFAMRCLSLNTMTLECRAALEQFFGIPALDHLALSWTSLDGIYESLVHMSCHPAILDARRERVHEFWREHWREEHIMRRWVKVYGGLAG